MKNISRRQFLTKGAQATVAGLTLAQYLNQVFANGPLLNIPVGFQTYPIREEIGKNFAPTLKMMADLGYKVTEMCSPKGYKGEYAPLIDMKPSEMRKIINDAGLTCPSCHFGMHEFTDDLDSRIEFSKELGLKHMVCSSFGLPKTATLNDYLVAADKLNKAGEKIKSAGMQAGFHNHSGEFATLDGQLIYDALMKRLDPSLVKMQFQTEVIRLGYKAADYFKKYPGRFISSHLSDWTADNKQAPIGKGMIDWKEFFAAAKTGGVEYFFVEMDKETFKDSVEFIKQV
jgi:sugar phosphate isomerase/epimerase